MQIVSLVLTIVGAVIGLAHNDDVEADVDRLVAEVEQLQA